MIRNLHLLHQDDTRKPSHLLVLPFQPETPDPAKGSYLCHPCSIANGSPARPPDLSYAGQSHNESSDMWLVVVLPSSKYFNLSPVDFSPRSRMNEQPKILSYTKCLSREFFCHCCSYVNAYYSVNFI